MQSTLLQMVTHNFGEALTAPVDGQEIQEGAVSSSPRSCGSQQRR